MGKKNEREHDDRCDCVLGIPMSRWEADADSNDGLTNLHHLRLFKWRRVEAISNRQYPPSASLQDLITVNEMIQDYTRLIAMFSKRVDEAVQEILDGTPPRPLCRNPMCDRKGCVGCDDHTPK